MHIFYSRRFPTVPAGVVNSRRDEKCFISTAVPDYSQLPQCIATVRNNVVRTRCCERSFVNTPRRTTIHNCSQPITTNVNTPMRTTVHNYSRLFPTVPNQCEHANAHNCSQLFKTIPNRSQPM